MLASNNNNHRRSVLERISQILTKWIGSPASLVIHTLLFIVFLWYGYVNHDTERALIVLTTAVSLEAIYLSIFIQMTVNRNTRSLEEVEENIDEIHEEIDEIAEGEEDEGVGKTEQTLNSIHQSLQKLAQDFEKLQKQTEK